MPVRLGVESSMSIHFILFFSQRTKILCIPGGLYTSTAENVLPSTYLVQSEG
jgi:hypothetical protein